MDPAALARAAADRMWADDRASRALGMELDDVAPGTAVVSMTVREDMVNGHGIGHGGFTFTLADTAFAFACNSHNRVTVAAGAQIRFRRPVLQGERLVATAVERSRSVDDGIYDVTVTRDDEVVAVFEGRAKEIGGVLVDDAESSL